MLNIVFFSETVIELTVTGIQVKVIFNVSFELPFMKTFV